MSDFDRKGKKLYDDEWKHSKNSLNDVNTNDEPSNNDERPEFPKNKAVPQITMNPISIIGKN